MKCDTKNKGGAPVDFLSFSQNQRRSKNSVKKSLKLQKFLYYTVSGRTATTLKVLFVIVLFTVLGLLFWVIPPTLNVMVHPINFSINQTKWLSQNIDSYRYTFINECGLCAPMTPVVVKVRKGVVVSVMDRNGSILTNWGQPYKDYYKQMGTVDALFDYVTSDLWLAKLKSTAIIHVEYDPRYGFPTKLCSGDTMLADSYGCTVVMDFEVLK